MSKKSNGKLSAPNVISTGIDITKKHFKDLFILACIFIVLPSVILAICSISVASLFTLYTINSVNSFQSFPVTPLPSIGFGSIFGFLILSLIIGIWTTAGTFGIVKLTHDRKASGSLSWQEAMKFSFSKLGTSILFLLFSCLFGIVLSIILIIITCVGCFIIALISSASTGFAVFLSFIGIICLIVLSIYISMYLLFMTQGIAIQELGVWDSFKLSATIVNGRVWNVFVKQFLIALLVIIASLVLSILNLIPLLGALISIIGTSILTTYTLVCTTIMFDDYNEVDNSGINTDVPTNTY